MSIQSSDVVLETRVLVLVLVLTKKVLFTSLIQSVQFRQLGP